MIPAQPALTYYKRVKTSKGNDLFFRHFVEHWHPAEERVGQLWKEESSIRLSLPSRVE